MKLQLNQSGAWRNVAEFPLDREADVRAAAVALALAAGHCSLRIVDPSGTVAASWTSREGWINDPFHRARDSEGTPA